MGKLSKHMLMLVIISLLAVACGSKKKTNTSKKPVQPANTNTPTKPQAKPVQPANTNTPTKPVQPANTNTPTKPVQPANTNTPTKPTGPFTLASSEFVAGGNIPTKYTGNRVNPPLFWKNPPVNTEAFVLILFDKRVRSLHWYVAMPKGVTALPENLPKTTLASSQITIAGRTIYQEPDFQEIAGPGHGYEFRLYALATTKDVTKVHFGYNIGDGAVQPVVENFIISKLKAASTSQVAVLPFFFFPFP